MFHGHSLDMSGPFTVRPFNDTCDLCYLVLVRLETNQDPGGAGCAAGYAAPMCIQCDRDYFSHGPQCERCRTSKVVSTAVVVAAVLVLAGLGAAFIWHRRSAESQPTNPSCRTALTQQAKAQVPILLQLCGSAIAINLMQHMPWREMEWTYVLCRHWNWVPGCSVSMSFAVFCCASCSAHCCLHKGQLWTILAMLASTPGPEDRDASKVSEYWELPYIQTLQLSISSLKDIVNLQCKFEARTNGDQHQVLFFSSFFWKGISRGVEAWWLPLCLELCMCMYSSTRLYETFLTGHKVEPVVHKICWVLVFRMSWP